MELFFECVAGFRQQSSFASGYAQQGVFPAASSPAVSHFGQVGRSRNCFDGVRRHDGMVPATADLGDRNASLVDLDHDDDGGRTRNDFDFHGDPVSRRQARDEFFGTVIDVFRPSGLPRDVGSRMAATLLFIESHGWCDRRLSFRPFGNEGYAMVMDRNGTYHLDSVVHIRDIPIPKTRTSFRRCSLEIRYIDLENRQNEL